MAPRGPSAAFTPIAPDLNLGALVEETPNFEYVTRVSCEMIEQQSMDAFEKLILLHVIIGGKPLVIDGFQHKLDEWTFTSQWLQDNCGNKFEQARDLSRQSNMPLSIGHYLNNMAKLTNQWNRQNYTEPDRQRIYLKDIDCPKLWQDKLKEHIPPSVFYLNDSTGDTGGPGSNTAYDKGIARCGDLMSCLPPDMRAENLMCYIGHEGTYTPAHREMCASLGQNLMVETSGLKDDGSEPAKPGSSIWFMTETKDRHLVSEYWLSTLGHDIEVEKHFAQIAAWKNAPFTTYVVEQRAGDFILIPPLAPHQVWNRGTRTMKVAWNRTTVETLEMALHEALPRARMVCRDEQYKNKAMVYFALQRYSELLKQADMQMRSTQNPQTLDGLKYSTKIRQLQKDFKRLFALYTEILLSEMLSPVTPSEKRGQYLPFESFVTCSYCRCNIFNRFLTCTTCIVPLENGEEDTYDVCMDCFAMGRSCTCISGYKWVEQFPWQELIQKHDLWRQQVINSEGGLDDKSPKSLQSERKTLKKKTLAQVCQEQVKLRPWSDPNNPLQALTILKKREIGRPPIAEANAEEDIDEDGYPKKRAKRKDYIDKNYLVEHVSLYPEEKWKLASCSHCDRSYSYGSLWRMFDLMPLTVMENTDWLCPYCLKICSCGACRRRGAMKPYEPKGTVLGHDTKAVADPRSMEHLVDFSHSNMRWIAAVGDDHPHESRRLNRRIEEAEMAKSRDPTLDDNYIDSSGDGLFVDSTFADEPEIPVDLMLDPALTTGQPSQANRHFTSGDHRTSVRASSSIQKNGQVTAAEKSSNANSSSVYEFGINSRPPIGAPTLGQDHPSSFMSNGITYEYPDPTDTQSTPATYPAPHDQLHQTQAKEANAKRKSRNYDLIETDLVSTAPEVSIWRMSQNQMQQNLQEAKENGRYIIAEAALTGKTLVVTLPLPANRLATAVRSRPSRDIMNTSNTVARDLFQSGLVSGNGATFDVGGSKKRKTKSKEDYDTDFIIRQPGDRTSTTAMAGLKDGRGPRANYITADTSSEDEDIVMEDAEDPSAKKSQGPRPLPKYLVRRSEGQDSLDELPAEKPRRNALPNVHKDDSGKFKNMSSVGTGRPRLQPLVKRSTEKSIISSSPTSSPPETLREANRKAKMKAVSWADDDALSSEESTTEDESPRPVQTGGKLMAVPRSIFERKGIAGTKIKIASAKNTTFSGQSQARAKS